jgi:Ca2+-transporting ATPase
MTIMESSPKKNLGASAHGAADSIWHTKGVDDVLSELHSSREGLSLDEVNRRVAKHGKNELVDKGGKSFLGLVWVQLRSVMILVLVAAGVVAFFVKGGIGEFPVDAVAIFSIVALFVVLGVVQEYRAQQAIAALKRMAAPMVRAVRGGQVIEIAAPELVPGDVIKLEAGAVVPADCRVTRAIALKTQESALTGESEPVDKTAEVIPGDATLALGDRKNLLYASTFVTAGRGEAVVVGTGMTTEIGRIAAMIQSAKVEQTPLQKRLDKLGKVLAVVALVVAVAVAAIGMIFEGKDLATVLILGISIAVAIVPEGLPAVLTVTLALGAQRMLKRRALIRRLPAVETLGSVTVICSDKTGTLTQNKMTVTAACSASGRPVELTGRDAFDNLDAEVRALLAAASLCNDTVEKTCEQTQSQELIGDPTETALVAAVARTGTSKREHDTCYPRVAELAFTSERKLMTTLHEIPATQKSSLSIVTDAFAKGGYLAVTKGAADKLLARATSLCVKGEKRPITELDRKRLERAVESMTSNGMRVLAVGAKAARTAPVDGAVDESLEHDLTLLGLIGMIDPPREEAKDAVAKCKSAGIEVIMITGDHPLTARAIAADLGIAPADAPVVTGAELEKMDVDALKAKLRTTRVFARVSPEHKLKIVQALHEEGHVVAMTGDGVNDAPALKQANIGVAMGTGTDVAKEAADMVLTDDNFATIVEAIEEGRTVYDNLRRFVMFSISGNIAKVVVVAIAPLIAMKAMLTPIQILFSNLLTDGLVGLGLGVEKGEKDVMKRPPIGPEDGILAGAIGRHIAIVGPLVGALMLGLGYFTWPTEQTTASLALWGTSMFTTLAFIQIARAWSSRSFKSSVLTIGLAGNGPLSAMAALAVLLQLTVVYVAGAQTFFGTVALGAQNIGVAVLAALVVLGLMELVKAAERRWGDQDPMPAKRLVSSAQPLSKRTSAATRPSRG